MGDERWASKTLAFRTIRSKSIPAVPIFGSTPLLSIFQKRTTLATTQPPNMGTSPTTGSRAAYVV